MLTAGTTAQLGQLFRFLFTTVPQWVQIAGILVGVPAAIIIAWQLVKHRRALLAWWLERARVVRIALVTAVGVAGLAFVASGLWGYNYVMHENDFCQACHVMDTAWNRFQVSAHKNLQCHSCHRQPLYVSTKELFWWVLERRMSIPPHDKVPTAVCGECHMRPGTDSARTLVTLTAGHALHLTSDSSALKNVQCTTCHGRDFHKFKPTNFACAQSGCHNTVRVNLGAMSRRGFMHCTSCHDFRGPIPRGTTVAQAKLALVPRAMDCSSCHAMSEKVQTFDLAADPHEGNCGTCHDVHRQKTPRDTWKTCATANCHANADTLTAFHRGLGQHTIDNCGACHQAHSWRVNGTDCRSCHTNIDRDQGRARRVSRHAAVRVQFHFASRRVWAPPAIVADTTFPHSRHKTVACATCHSTTTTHGGLRISRPAGCLGCHHSARQPAACTACHGTALAARTLAVTFSISARKSGVTRPLTFAHDRHAVLACTRCHGPDMRHTVVASCQDCHGDHHVATSDCAGCHVTARDGHDRFAHDGCSGCHVDAAVAALPPSRMVCLACHQAQRTHFPARDCAACHALTAHATLGASRSGGAR